MALWNALYLTPGQKPIDAAAQRASGTAVRISSTASATCGRLPYATRRASAPSASGASDLRRRRGSRGWHAPALDGACTTPPQQQPIPWTETELFRYLRFGHSAQHGSANGPMAPVVRELAQLPEPRRGARWRTTSRRSTRPGRRGRQPPAQAKGLASMRPSRHANIELGDNPAPVQRRLRRVPPRRQWPPTCSGRNLPLALSSKLHGAPAGQTCCALILEGRGASRPPPSSASCRRFRDALDDAQVAPPGHLHCASGSRRGSRHGRDLEAASARGFVPTRAHGDFSGGTAPALFVRADRRGPESSTRSKPG